MFSGITMISFWEFAGGEVVLGLLNSLFCFCFTVYWLAALWNIYDIGLYSIGKISHLAR